MTETSNSPMTARVRAFLDRPHRLLIGGEWVDAASGKTFETRDPATGEVLATVAHAEQADIDAAVAALDGLERGDLVAAAAGVLTPAPGALAQHRDGLPARQRYPSHPRSLPSGCPEVGRGLRSSKGQRVPGQCLRYRGAGCRAGH